MVLAPQQVVLVVGLPERAVSLRPPGLIWEGGRQERSLPLLVNRHATGTVPASAAVAAWALVCQSSTESKCPFFIRYINFFLIYFSSSSGLMDSPFLVDLKTLMRVLLGCL